MSNRSLADSINEQKQKYNTTENNYDMFPIGTKVQVITFCQDFNFFDGNETGIVTKNHKGYLGIIVKFDKHRRFKDFTETEFGFEPDDLIVLEKANHHLKTDTNSQIKKIISDKELLSEIKNVLNSLSIEFTPIRDLGDYGGRYSICNKKSVAEYILKLFKTYNNT